MVSTVGLRLALPERAPIEVVGPPGSLRIDLTLANDGDAPVVVRGASIRALAARDGGRLLPAVGASLAAMLQAGETATASLRLIVGAHTPSGEYLGEIDVAGNVRPLALTIVEHVRLAIEPMPVVLDSGAGTTYRKTVLFRNLGNVPLHIGHPGPVPIGEELPFAAVAAEIVTAGRASDTAKELVGKLFGRREARLLTEIGVMNVRLSEGTFALAPGTSNAATLDCSLPNGLSPHRRYHAYAPLYDADLAFLIASGGNRDHAASA
jgi:hypothetical protein